MIPPFASIGRIGAALAAVVPCTVAAAPAVTERPPITIVFQALPSGPPCPVPRAVQHILRRHVLLSGGGRIVDVTRWRPSGEGAFALVRIVLEADHVETRLTCRPPDGPARCTRAVFQARKPAEFASAAHRAAASIVRELTGRSAAPAPLSPPAAALEALEKALAEGPRPTPSALLKKRDHLAKAVRLAPDWVLVRIELARVINAQGDSRAALRHLARARALAPADPDVLAETALAFRHLGRLAEAISTYTRALRLAPDDPALHNNFGVALLAAGQTKGALQHFARAREIEPLYPEPLINLATHYRSIGEERQAAKHYRQAIALAPRAAAPRIALAKLLADAGEHRAALEQLETAAAANPDNAEARFALALALARRQKYPAAIENLKAVLRMAPEFREARYNLGLCYHYTGRDDDAIRLFERAIARQPDYGHLYYGLGLVYEARDDKSLAEEAFKMALEKDPGLVLARNALKRLRDGETRPKLAWPFGLLCGESRSGSATASALPAVLTLAALFLPALLLRRRNHPSRHPPRRR